MRRRFKPTPRRASRRPTGGDTEAFVTVLRPAPDGSSLEYHLAASGRYQPERPAPPCSDHDSPLFDDCGDAASFELDSFSIDEIVDEEGDVVAEGHRFFGKTLDAKQIKLTTEELKALQDAAAESYDPGPEYDDDDSGWDDD